jgi:hypothetical protein
VRVEKSADIRFASGEWKYYIAVPVLFERKADEEQCDALPSRHGHKLSQRISAVQSQSRILGTDVLRITET